MGKTTLAWSIFYIDNDFTSPQPLENVVNINKFCSITAKRKTILLVACCFKTFDFICLFITCLLGHILFYSAFLCFLCYMFLAM